MSPTRRSLLTGTAALLVGGHLSPAVASAIDQTDDDNADGYLDSPEHLAWLEGENHRRFRPAVQSAKFRMEFAIDVRAADGRRTIESVPVERTGCVNVYDDGSARIAIWGPEGWSTGQDVSLYGNLTPELHMTETYLNAEDFAPMRQALFDVVDMNQPPVCPSAIASNWYLRRHLRIW